MLKRLLVGGGLAGVLTVGIIVGSLTLGPVFAHSPDNTPPVQAVAQGADDGAIEAAGQGPNMDDVEEEVDDRNEGMSEAEDSAPLQAEATISAADAEAAALAANPDTSVVKTELDNENGILVYSVELSNGKEVKVDAGTGQILPAEVDGLDGENESGD